MQYKVPQNVDIADRVIGPLTLRQFIILTVAASLCLVLFLLFIGPLRIFFWLFGGIIMGGAVFIAFAKYGDQNMEVFVLSAISTFLNPRKRVWKKENLESKQVEPVAKKPQAPVEEKKSLDEARDDLEKLAQIVDSGGNISMGTRDRIIPFGTHIEADSAPDILEKAEEPNAKVDPLIEEESAQTPKREPLISEVASIPPDQNFEYNKVEIKNTRISKF